MMVNWCVKAGRFKNLLMCETNGSPRGPQSWRQEVLESSELTPTHLWWKKMDEGAERPIARVHTLQQAKRDGRDRRLSHKKIKSDRDASKILCDHIVTIRTSMNWWKGIEFVFSSWLSFYPSIRESVHLLLTNIYSYSLRRGYFIGKSAPPNWIIEHQVLNCLNNARKLHNSVTENMITSIYLQNSFVIFIPVWPVNTVWEDTPAQQPVNLFNVLSPIYLIWISQGQFK